MASVAVCCSTTTEPFDTDKMAQEFVNQFPQQAFSVGQELVFSFMEKKVLSVIVRELEGNCCYYCDCYYYFISGFMSHYFWFCKE